MKIVILSNPELISQIKSKEGNLGVTWGDGYFYEAPISLMVLAERRMMTPHLPRRVCFSKEFKYVYCSKR